MENINVKKICVLLSVLLFTTSCSQNNVFSLKVGQCFGDAIPAGGKVENVDKVDCEEPHLNEIYAVLELPDGDFQRMSIEEDSVELCLEAFEPFVGLNYAESVYEFDLLRPSSESWEKMNDREVICYLYDLRGQLKQGTAANSGL